MSVRTPAARAASATAAELSVRIRCVSRQARICMNCDVDGIADARLATAS